MPERTSYAPGTPSWADLASDDVEQSAAFYGALFGWEHQLAGLPEETGGYGMFTKDGKMVAGVGPKQNEQQPSVWTTYIATDDASAVARRVQEAGGQVLLEPFAVLDVGHMGVFADSAGAAFAVWQAGRHIGAELVSEPGTMTWNELQTRDVAASKAFYEQVFGWEAATHEMQPGFQYTEWKLDGQSVGGMMQMAPEVPDFVPSNWLVYFGADDADASAARIKELGGSLFTEVMSIPQGRFVVAADPQGSPFATFQAQG